MQISFRIPVIPIAQPRQRHAMIAGRILNYTPAKHPVNVFKLALINAAESQVRMTPNWPAHAPFSVSATFLMPRPKRLQWKNRPMVRQSHVGRPDIENIGKALLDALTGIVWNDDSQVAHLECWKLYASGDEVPGVEVNVCQLDDEDKT